MNMASIRGPILYGLAVLMTVGGISFARDETRATHFAGHHLSASGAVTARQKLQTLTGANRIEHRGQDLFLNGANVAWLEFGNDVGDADFNESGFVNMFDEIQKAGGNTMRWWIHINGSFSPTYTNGVISGISDKAIEDIRTALDLASERGVLLNLCLWSFDMLRPQWQVDVAANYNLLTNEFNTKAYINHALIPLVKALKDHPAILAWEIFNEPEGMSLEFNGWAETRIEMKYIQKFINLTAGAIHREAPEAKVTNGSWSFKANTDVDGYFNYYTDKRLIAAGHDPLGYLDFYEVHYYDWGKTQLSPFHHPVSHWQLDKPLVIAEFDVKDTLDISRQDLYSILYDQGYAGALGWQYTEHWWEIKEAIVSIRDRDDIHPD